MGDRDLDLVIRGGTVVTAADVVRCDVGVREGRIEALGRDLGRGAREIDATGRLVMPGGIDAHCHVDQVSSTGVLTADDFESATRSAACGGTTTIVPFACQHRGQSLAEVVAAYHARAADRAVIDYAFHLIISDPDRRALVDELPALVRRGYPSFKVYMTYDALRLEDRQILDLLAVARREGGLVMVHAENHGAIGWLTEKLEGEGRTAPVHHAAAHTPIAEREAIQRAIALAEVADAPIFIVHVSGPDAIEPIRDAQARGVNVYAETCPQYLLLTAKDLDRPGFEGAKYMCSPPPRDEAAQQAVWRALAGGVFQVFSSDHAGYRYQDPEGKMKHGAGASFKKVPNGVPGLEVRLPLLFSEGVGKSRIDLTAFVALAATNAAKIYGLYPAKGTIAVGADADIAIWDPERRVTIRQSALHDRMDYSPYEGLEVRGWPIITLSRGEVVCEGGAPTASAGRGRFVARLPPLPRMTHFF